MRRQSHNDNKSLCSPEHFEQGPLKRFASLDALEEFNELRKVTAPLVTGAAEIPAMAMRPGDTALVPLLRYLPSLFKIISNGVEVSTGVFEPFLNGPLFTVKDPWLRDWLDALAFSLSGLPASRTSAGALAYVLYDMHREGAALDYPKGGLGEVVNALVFGVEQQSKSGINTGSKVNLNRHVESIDFNEDGSRATGLTVKKKGGGKIVVRAHDGVIYNAPVWLLKNLIKNKDALVKLGGGVEPSNKIETNPIQSWITSQTADPDSGRRSVLRSTKKKIKQDEKSTTNLLHKCNNAELTGSFLHLHLALDAEGLNLSELEPHYTVMDRGLEGDGLVTDGVPDGPVGELNMIALSNPCVIDRTLAPEGYIVLHAYGAGNEPFDIWTNFTETSGDHDTRYQSSRYEALKNVRAAPLWRAVESIIPDAKERTVLAMLGSPLTHERFLQRPKGSYGAAFEDCAKDGSTPIANLLLCGDGVFPGIGIPAVALSGASAANGMVNIVEQWMCMNDLKSKSLI